MTTPTPTSPPSTTLATSASANSNAYDITTASGFSALLPCASYAIQSAFVSESYLSCPKVDFDAGRFDEYLSCLCADARDSVLRQIGYAVSAGESYKSLGCNEYQVFSANQVYNGYCSGRGFALTTVTTGAYPVTTVTSLGGPAASSTSTPPTPASSRGLTTTTKIIISVLGGLVGLVALYWVYRFIRMYSWRWNWHRDEKKRVAAVNRAAKDREWVQQQPRDIEPPRYMRPASTPRHTSSPARSPQPRRVSPSLSPPPRTVVNVERERADSRTRVEDWRRRNDAASSAGDLESVRHTEADLMSNPSHMDDDYQLDVLRTGASPRYA